MSSSAKPARTVARLSTWSDRGFLAIGRRSASRSYGRGGRSRSRSRSSPVTVQLDKVLDNWYPIRSTRGVIQLVRFSEHPVPIDDEIVQMIRERLASDLPRVPYLKPGERVLITDGCFADVEAIFIANDGDERVVLLMNILHRDQTLSFRPGSVRKVREPNS